MDVRGSIRSMNCKKDRALTPLRVISGIICLIILLSTAFMMIVYFGFMSAVVLRIVSVHYSRKATSAFFGAWLALWPFLFEKINKTEVKFSGDKVPARERVLLIANHRTEVDWMYLWDLAWRKGCLGYLKYILKSSLMKLPVFGWGFLILEFIPVERKWEVDGSNMHKMLSSFKDPRDPLWLVLFPEGTDFTERKCLRNQKYAAEKGLPIFSNVLLPKAKGFCACLEELRGSLDAVYDVTIAYKFRCPSLLDNVFGVAPSEVHIHVRRIALDEIPTTEEDIATWLINTFHLKDKLLSEFYSEGHFPDEGTEGQLSTMKCLVNFVGVILLISACSFFTFLSSFLKIYVFLVCCYLASATYLNFRPKPLFSSVKATDHF